MQIFNAVLSHKTDNANLYGFYSISADSKEDAIKKIEDNGFKCLNGVSYGRSFLDNDFSSVDEELFELSVKSYILGIKIEALIPSIDFFLCKSASADSEKIGNRIKKEIDVLKEEKEKVDVTFSLLTYK